MHMIVTNRKSGVFMNPSETWNSIDDTFENNLVAFENHFSSTATSPNRERVFASNALIENITFQRNTWFVTISYNNCPNCRNQNQQVVLVVDRNTRIQDESGAPLSPRDLTTGMIINAVFSSAMTRSIPPQAQAFGIRVVNQMPAYETTTGRIVEVNSRSQSLTTMNPSNPSSIIRFNITPDTVILNQWGRTVSLSRLMPGLRVRIQHATFMTASIPPQTTAFVIQIL